MHSTQVIAASLSLLAFANAAPALKQQRDACPPGLQWNDYNNCDSGFVGCGTVSQCNGHGRFWTTLGDCPAGTGYVQQCSGGSPRVVYWRGCSTEDVCTTISRALSPSAPAVTVVPAATSTDIPPTSTTAPAPTTETTAPSDPVRVSKCPSGTWYNALGGCPSGFEGCMGTTDYCSGEKRFWSSCPEGLGSYYNCSNGFRGCTTDNDICSKAPFNY